MKLLVCGGYGFIGSAFIRNRLKNHAQDEIVNIDNLSIGSNLENLSEVKNNKNYHFIKEDIKNQEAIKEITRDVDLIINFAAESHVDRSIANPRPFIETNIVGTYSLLEAARIFDKLFIHISTDEVYGDAENDISFTELDVLNPNNPYSATKASADHLVLAYHKTYGTKCIITRGTNNFGPYQHPEKLIPKTIIRALNDLKIPLHGGGSQFRSWIYVLDNVLAIDSLLLKGKHGEIYNITAQNEISVRTIVEKILKIMGKSSDLTENVADRPSQDKRYFLNSSKIQKTTGWKPQYPFDETLEETVRWYMKNQKIWKPLVTEKILHPEPWTLTW